MAIHYAHLVMLAEQGIVPRADAARDPRRRSTRIDRRRGSAGVSYDGTCEDLFFYVERLIVERAAARTPPAGCTPRARATTST